MQPDDRERYKRARHERGDAHETGEPIDFGEARSSLMFLKGYIDFAYDKGGSTHDQCDSAVEIIWEALQKCEELATARQYESGGLNKAELQRQTRKNGRLCYLLRVAKAHIPDHSYHNFVLRQRIDAALRANPNEQSGQKRTDDG